MRWTQAQRDRAFKALKNIHEPKYQSKEAMVLLESLRRHLEEKQAQMRYLSINLGVEVLQQETNEFLRNWSDHPDRCLDPFFKTVAVTCDLQTAPRTQDGPLLPTGVVLLNYNLALNDLLLGRAPVCLFRPSTFSDHPLQQMWFDQFGTQNP